MTAPPANSDPSSAKTTNGIDGVSDASKSATNVRVVGRIRPMAAYELEKGCKQVLRCLPGSGGGGSSSEVIQIESAEKRWFELDAAFDGNSSQQEVYVRSGAQKAVTEDLFQGFNCTILAYGQTGAGTWIEFGCFFLFWTISLPGYWSCPAGALGWCEEAKRKPPTIFIFF
jgi:hypothetical protein